MHILHVTYAYIDAHTARRAMTKGTLARYPAPWHCLVSRLFAHVSMHTSTHIKLHTRLGAWLYTNRERLSLARWHHWVVRCSGAPPPAQSYGPSRAAHRLSRAHLGCGGTSIPHGYAIWRSSSVAAATFCTRRSSSACVAHRVA